MVYVDDMKRAWRSMPWLHTMRMSHMIADTTDELLTMADRLGLDHNWIQNAGTAREHFDVSLTKRAMAVRFGAREITQKQLAMMTRERRKNANECGM